MFPSAAGLARRPDFGAIIFVVAIFIVLSMVDFSGWWSAETFGNIVHFSAILGCIAMGEALVIIAKEIDLSGRPDIRQTVLTPSRPASRTVWCNVADCRAPLPGWS